MTRKKSSPKRITPTLTPQEWAQKYKPALQQVQEWAIKHYGTNNIDEAKLRMIDKAGKLVRKHKRGNRTQEVTSKFKDASDVLKENQKFKNKVNGRRGTKLDEFSLGIIIPFIKWCRQQIVEPRIEPSAKSFETFFDTWILETKEDNISLHIRAHGVMLPNPKVLWRDQEILWELVLDRINYLKKVF